MKKTMVILSVSFCLFIAGCGNDGKANPDIRPTSPQSTEADSVGGLKLSLEYNPKTDSPRGYDWGYMSESENGYFFVQDKLNTYWDKKTGMYLPLCSNPDCNHKNTDCVASYKENISFINSAYYYDGYVYKLGEESGKHNLYRIKEDGSEFEKCFSFFRTEDFGSSHFPEICIHRGYVYYVIPNQTEMKLQRVKLEGGEPEVIYEMSGERQELYRIKAYGNHIFFQAGNFVDDKMIDINAGIYEYDINAKEVRLVLDGAVSEYGVYGNSLYYYNYKDSGIYELNFSDMSSRLIIENVSTDFRTKFCEDKIVWGDKNSIYIYGYDGKKAADIDNKDIIWINGFNNNILFGETEENIVYYDISSADKEWKVLKYGN